MSSLEGNERGRAGKGAIQYVSDKFNGIPNKDILTGVKAAVGIKRDIDEAYVMHEEEKNKISSGNSNRTRVVTGEEMRKAVNDGTYREILER